MSRHLKDYISDYEYKCLAYDKSVVMWDTLRKSVGEKKFLGGLKKYYSTCRFQVATPQQLVGCFEKTGVDVGGFFESFLEGKAIL
jgi:aminopeptidase N